MFDKDSIRYDEIDHALDFYIKSEELVEKFMEVIESMAHEAITENDYKRTIDLLTMLVDGEEALEKFKKPKFQPTYQRTSTGLLEDE